MSSAPPAAAASAAGATAAARDACSLASDPREVAVLHAHYELSVDFATRTLEGWAQLLVEAGSSSAAAGAGVTRLTLDTRDLTIHSVSLLDQQGQQERPLQFSLGPRHEALGSALTIELPAPGLLTQAWVGIRFTTSPASTALQFLAPEQTAGGAHPYLFSQCQAIHARSLVPCQDSPAVKSSYSAAVRVPAELTAVMSAVPCDGPPPLPGSTNGGSGSSAPEGTPHLPEAAGGGDSSTRVFYFHQATPIPSYLTALAVGQLESRELSDRSRVWSEPSVVDSAAYEFAHTSDYLTAAEALAGPYVWGRYDLLVLPPSFPYGGMENPCITFVTPTLLAGDRSLTNVVAHEIAHSWTGNLVTNASWSHFWLNEGFTVFLERKIVGRLQGEAALQFQMAQGALTLAAEVEQIGRGHNFTRLVPDLSANPDPDDAFSRVPYEKGCYFLFHLQDLVGGPSKFEPFMRHYLQTFAFKTVDSGQFRATFEEFFRDTPAASTVDWQTWLHAPGMPPVKNTYDQGLAEAAYSLASRWHTCDVMGIGAEPPAGASADDIAGWGCAQIVAFLDKLGELRSLTPLAAATCRQMDGLYGLDASTNCEIRCAWYKLCCAAKDATIYPRVADMLSTQGRMKYLRPLYRALCRSGADGKQLALDTFRQAAARYHPIAAKMVATDLGLRGPAEGA